MMDVADKSSGRGFSLLRVALWSVAALLLLAPAVAMRLHAPGVDWTASDFVFAAVLIGGTGLLFELTVRLSRSHAYRAGAAFALAAAFLIVWANGAVGMIGDEDNPYNLLFGGVILVALAGAALAGFRAAGTALAMLAAAIAQLAISLAGMSQDMRGGILSAAFAGLWLLSAALFRHSAREQGRA